MITVKSKKGFSLTELLVVIAIIGILSILVIPAYSNYVTRTRLTEALTVLDGYKKDVQSYFIAHGVSTQEQLENYDVTDHADVGSDTTSVMSDIVGHNGRIVGVSTIKGTTYQIALTPRIEGGTFNWTCSISIVEQDASFDNSYNGQVFFGFIDNNSGSYAAPSSSILPRGCNATDSNQNTDFEAYRSERQTLDTELMNSHNQALNAWQQRTAIAAAQDQDYSNLKNNMDAAEIRADTAFSDYNKYQDIANYQSTIDHYQGLIDNATSDDEIAQYESAIQHYQGLIDSVQSSLSSQAGNDYSNAQEAATFFNQQRDIYNQNRESANTRYTELQDQQRNVSSSINGNTSQGFDNDYNSAYEQYNNAMDSLQSSVNNSAVNVDRVDTYQGEDYNAHNFGQISDKFNSWQYRNI
ncbi:prepilin-type N-terminal cleavage/methylation domain-containing protein [Francisella tularensis subsp. novicida FSC159]|uniref:pilin n=1 Tax=Francisella tularensis TaxID=263 RepID=UPI001C0EDDD4|nr:pilin [Francisella tularensis]MBK2112258.1 prepilin-type N-terminal cleavage/methylation domain-containing protein [Francisella tularensis subsp. novicida FSC159]